MSKRTKQIIETPQSIALKQLRIKREVSLQKLADLMDLSKALVHQMETGRANITQEYIQKILVALEYSMADFEKLIIKKRPNDLISLRQRCHDKLDNIEESKLEIIFDYLTFSEL